MPAANAEHYRRPDPWSGCPTCGAIPVAGYYATSYYADVFPQSAYSIVENDTTIVLPDPAPNNGLLHCLLEGVPYHDPDSEAHPYNDIWYLDAKVTYCPSCGHVHAENLTF